MLMVSIIDASDRKISLAIHNGRQVALITGASSGIGRATATLLARQGWDVGLLARSEDSLAEVAEECARAGVAVLTVTADIGRHPEVDAAFQAAVDRFGMVTAVVQSAGVVGYGRFEDVPADIFDRVITTNLLGAANVARASLRHFHQVGGGRLVIVGSLLGKIAVPFMSPYVTSKWGVQALTRMLQIEARETPGIQISLISPGSVNTPAYSQAANYIGCEGRPPPPVDPPEKVAAAIVRSLRKPARERSVGIANHIVILGFRLLPAVFDVLVAPLMKVGGLSRRVIAPHEGSVLNPQPEGNAQHGVWGRFGRRSRAASPSRVAVT